MHNPTQGKNKPHLWPMNMQNKYGKHGLFLSLNLFLDDVSAPAIHKRD
jgi:hypothetical protein